ncbi:MAG TPA: DNA polymerase III subunit alpha [Anaerolineales bacterium]|nr:DNA polymerase III subunit alpha [Anaerolineales bacterium]
MFNHLHTHSHFSLLTGLASPAQLAAAAAREGMQALALTDLDLLTGSIEFYDACRSAGVQPILGLEVAVVAPTELPAETGNLILLAMDRQGWRSLCRLSSALQAGEGSQNSAPLTFESLAQDSAGLLCLTGGQHGLVTEWMRRRQGNLARDFLVLLDDVFPGRLYVELNLQSDADRMPVQALVAVGRALGLPLAAASPVHYLLAEQAGLQRVMAAMRLNTRLADLPESACAPARAEFASQAEMAARFSDYPQALAATQEIAERCRLELPLGQPLFPEIPVPTGIDDVQLLRQKAQAGALRRYGQLTSAASERIEAELRVIAEKGYAPLFLVMEEIMQFARQSGIPVSSRGSAASSLVAYCLGITTPDPLKLNLYFERFLNPARATPPDIDTDLCSRRRDEVIHFVYERFGPDRVAMVCTINRFRRRSALREVAKAHGFSQAEIKKMADALPQRWWGPAYRNNEAPPFGELEKRYNSPQYQAIFRDAAEAIGLPHHLSIHPGGIVISPSPMTDLVPTQMAAKGVVITQFDLDSIERLGLVKIDLLGIRGLTVLGDVAAAIQAKASQKYASPLEVLESIPGDDPETAEWVRSGRTIGCFQIESPGMRATLKEIQASCLDDLVAALALYRPGPLTGGLKDAFVRRHRGQEASEHLHPALSTLLADTHGIILYQEQVLRIASEIAGLSLADADLLRRAMSHFDPGEQMRTLKARFLAGAEERSGVPEAVAERIWQLMAAFAGYGFPKAHAASYAQVAWQAAWCKVHEPAVFMAAVMANWGGYYGQRIYLTEARRLGLTLRPPHIDYAQAEFSVSYLQGRPVLFMGLDQVRDLTRRTQARILRQRPFHSLQDFLDRVDPRLVEAENLIRAGGLEGLGNIPALLPQLKSLAGRGRQLSLFDFSQPAGIQPAGDAPVDWSLEEKVAAQEAILGVGVDAHPLELRAAQIQAFGAVTTLEAAACIGQRVRVAGMRQSWRRTSTERNELIYLMSFEDLEGMLEAAVLYPPGFTGVIARPSRAQYLMSSKARSD